MALPPAGTYSGSVGGRGVELEIGADGGARVRPAVNGADPGMPLRVVLRSGG
jgi:hypothetical protein